MTCEEGDFVLAQEHGGRYVAKVLSTDDHSDPEGNRLYGVQVLVVDEDYDTSNSLEEGTTVNVRPERVKTLEEVYTEHIG